MSKNHQLPLTIGRDDLVAQRDQLELVGGKAANLAELFKLAHGRYEVPLFFCVTSAAFALHLSENGLATGYQQFETAFQQAVAQRRQQNDLPKKQLQNLLHLSAELRAKIAAAPLPAPVRRAIAAQLRELQTAGGATNFSVAVRSSGVAEDLPGASFAGQYDSFLNQRARRQITQAVRQCFASNFGERVVLYKLELHAAAQRAHTAEPGKYGAMAVVIQQMVDAHAAGVGLTADPTTREEVCYINANFGLGETVVQGRATPDIWRIEADSGRILDKRIGDKEEVATATSTGGLRRRRLTQIARAGFCLSDEVVVKLAAEMERLKAHYRSVKEIAELDVEFVVDRQGRLYLVQVRADTTRNATLYDISAETLQTAQIIFRGGFSGHGGAVAGRLLIADGDPHQDDTVTQALRRMRAGDIVVAREMVLTWTPVLTQAGGVIVDKGGVTSHPAKIARERGIPAIVAAGDATGKLRDYDGHLITMSTSHLLVCAGEHNLVELRAEEVAQREQEAEAEAWRKERTRMKLSATEETLQAARALARSSLAVDAEGNPVADIVAGQPYWFRNPPFAYGQLQYDVYLAAFARLSERFGVDAEARLLGGLLCTSVAGMTGLGRRLRALSLAELEAIFADRQRALQRWNATCAAFACTEAGLSRLAEDWGQMLVYTHMHFEFNRAIEFLITQAKEAMTQQQRIAFDRYHKALVQFHTHQMLLASKQHYARLLHTARQHAHLFQSDQLSRSWQQEAPDLFQQAKEYVDKWCEVERDDIRLPLDIEGVLTQLKADVASNSGDEAAPFQPAFPRLLRGMETPQRLAELHARLAGHHERQHYLIPRGCHQIKEKLLRYGAQLVVQGMLNAPAELLEKSLAAVQSLAQAHPAGNTDENAGAGQAVDSARIRVLVLAGGGGTRGWPLSTTAKPKQLQSYTRSGRSLLQETLWRLRQREFIPAEQIYVMTTAPLAAAVWEQITHYGIAPEHLLVEPALAETGAAIGYAAKRIEAETPDATMLVLSADHIVRPVQRFQHCLRQAVQAAQAAPRLVVIGIAPTRADSNFGYHRFGAEAGRTGVFTVEHTVEKPDSVRAEQYVNDGRYYWDSGMFAWDVSTILAAFQRSAPEYYQELERIGHALGTAAERTTVEQAYQNLLRLKQQRAGQASIDYLILEKEEKVGVKAALFWIDVGNLGEPLRQLHRSPRAVVPDRENLIVGGGKRHVLALDSQRSNFFVTPPRRLFVKGVHELVVADAAETGATAIYPLARVGEIKALVATLLEDATLAGYCRGDRLPSEGHIRFIDSAGTLACSDQGLAAGVGVQDHVLIRYKHSVHVLGPKYKAEGAFLMAIAQALLSGKRAQVAALINQPPGLFDHVACLSNWAAQGAPLAREALRSIGGQGTNFKRVGKAGGK